MKILILEDEDVKYEAIEKFIHDNIEYCDLQRETNWYSYANAISRTKFDLIILDLIVPKSSKDKTLEDHHEVLVETTRDYQSKSFLTPALVLTQQSLDSGDFVHDLNLVDINVIPYNDHGAWQIALKHKLLSSQPKKKYDFVIVCALDKEADAFETAVDEWGPIKTISNLVCREVTIGETKGVIVRAHRMGLVAAAVVSTMALERFEPSLICMSGICGGVPDDAKMYDLLVTQSCHQHDAGKWSSTGFKSEHYDVQTSATVNNKLLEICLDSDLNRKLLLNLDPAVSEVPLGQERVTTRVRPDVATSSGSAVIAETGRVDSLSTGQRKLSGFDMEIYSVYEAARHAKNQPAFFAAKAVVDDGGSNKGDKFHRIGCLLSARLVANAIRMGISQINALD